MKILIAIRFGIKDHDVKFDIVAHSMGGLVARYYLRYGTQDLPPDGSLPELTWAGAQYVDNLIMVGPLTPAPSSPSMCW
jgi:triacylglycerol esterase/lipase EstA (alpha/beta hydrolase family)